MSRTHTHIVEAKFRNGLITINDVPMSILYKWNRRNFIAGDYKNQRNLKRYAFRKQDILNQIEEDEWFNFEEWDRLVDYFDGCECESCLYCG